MKTFFYESPLKYTGQELHAHFAYKRFDIQGDSIVAFIGPCEVSLDHMLDLADVKRNAPIFSENMLHFIVEHFDDDLMRVIACQRLLIDMIRAEICLDSETIRLTRRGDDLYDDIFKLTVSIATKSPVSCLIHTGVNISSKNTPVPTRGLADYGLSPQAVGTSVMNRYRAELESMRLARAKVRVCP